MIYCGLDVHKRSIHACLLHNDGKIRERRQLNCTREAIAALGYELGADAEVALEATTHTWAIVALLRPHVGRVVVANPMKTKAIAEAKIKTDKIDAEVLAQLLRCDFLPEVWVPDEDTARLRQLTGRRSALVSDRGRVKNRIHSTLAQQLIHVPFNELFSTKGRKWLGEGLDVDTLTQEAIDSDLRLLDTLDREIASIETRIAEEAYAAEAAKLLMTLPGVSLHVATTLLAALGDWRRFRSGEHAAAYLGLVPSTRQSGAHCYHGSITKAGDNDARAMMIEAAQCVGRQQGPLGAFFRRIAKRRGRNIAVVATARKMVVIAWQMLKDHEPYRYANPSTTAQKLASVRIHATGERRSRGVGKGRQAVSRSEHGGGTRYIPSLNEVYATEGLPETTEPDALAEGEKRALGEMDVDDHARQVHTAKRRPRSPAATGSKKSRKRRAAR